MDRPKQGDYRRNPHPDAQWFGQAGLGLFLHWGLSSVHGGIDLSWGMMQGTSWDQHLAGTNKLGHRDYFALADRFNPKRYDPDRWLSAAAEAGFKYAVLTAKHHEGYALWPSRYGDFGTRSHMQGKNLVLAYAEACRRHGLKVGLYYSPPDWYFNREYMAFHFDRPDKPKPDGWETRFHAYLRGQIEELLTCFGPIDLLFFDGGPPCISIEQIRAWQPGIVVNPRMHGYGDYLTPECKLPPEKPEGWWELCENWTDSAGSWGYMKEERYRSTGYVLARYVKVRAWEGNYLLNVAPDGNGELPELCYRRMLELKEWMKMNGEAVNGVTGIPVPEACNVPATRSGNTWYCHLLPCHEGVIRIQGITCPQSVTLLWIRQEAAVAFADRTLTIEVPDNFRTEQVDVVKVVW
ncbi:alpha-L-fucosidase [Paenibacillus cymbidii]|uniref:alpha-L-fucosidase n=1 Tax=Paenibacillus cymbidii TaxID=1639034 RepID=UPI001080330E|nr:alpha-L-fucosidase [Paenibacillus cymbidii]